MRKASFVFGMLLATAIGLAAYAGTARGVPKDFHVTLQRGACFGTCPVYRVSIASDGAVSYDGRRFVRVTGHRTRKISKKKVRQLYRAFMRADFFALNDRYVARVTDLPTYKLSLIANRRRKTVRDYGGHRMGMPRRVTNLERLVDETAGTKAWIKPDADN